MRWPRCYGKPAVRELTLVLLDPILYRLSPVPHGPKVGVHFFDELLEALCDVFGVEPGELLEREGHVKPARRKRGTDRGT